MLPEEKHQEDQAMTLGQATLKTCRGADGVPAESVRQDFKSSKKAKGYAANEGNGGRSRAIQKAENREIFQPAGCIPIVTKEEVEALRLRRQVWPPQKGIRMRAPFHPKAPEKTPHGYSSP